MNDALQRRLLMAAFGLLAGGSLYLLAKVIDQNLLAPRATLALVVFAVTFFAGFLVTAGPMRLYRAAAGAAGLGAGLAALISWAGLRFADVGDIFNEPILAMAGIVLGTVPLPFVIAATGPGWRDYPALFTESWSIFVRAALAWTFVALFWALILLSGALFGLVGLSWIDTLLDIPVVPWLITGGVLGLALAVAVEFSDYVSPYLILRLLRLLIPPVLAVLVVFVAALPFRGLSGLFGEFSVAAILLAMVAVGAALVAAAVDRTDADAVTGPVMQRAAQVLAVVLLFPAALAGYSVWLRVGQYGWTPERLFAATAALMALGYGVAYGAAMLRGPDWMARIRRANVNLAQVLIAVSVLWLTPVLNPQAISAKSQLARFDASGDVAALDIDAVKQWGHAGQAVVDQLTTLAVETGNAALSLRLAGGVVPEPVPSEPDMAALRAALVAVMPLQPVTATATRDMLLAAAYHDDLAEWLRNCEAKMPDGAPACVMVVADLWTDFPGEEAMLVQWVGGDYMSFDGLLLDAGVLQRRRVLGEGDTLPDLEEGRALIAALQKAPPALSAAPLNQISVGDLRLTVAP